jgi:uncharacterized protein (DUF1697 family)
MPIWIALLRGVNVGGRNLLPMKDLARHLEDLGCTSVTTYIQSGNVIFKRQKTKVSSLAELIGKTILDHHGFQAKVHLMSASDLEQAASANPFPHATADPKSLHLSFLSQEPEPIRLESLEAIKAESETYSLQGNVFYLHAPLGIGRSKLAARAETLLGVEATSRNWRTVSKLLELAQGIK